MSAVRVMSQFPVIRTIPVIRTTPSLVRAPVPGVFQAERQSRPKLSGVHAFGMSLCIVNYL